MTEPMPAPSSAPEPMVSSAPPPAPTRRSPSGLVLSAAVLLFVLSALAFLWALLFAAYAVLVGSLASFAEDTGGTFGSVDVPATIEAWRPFIVILAGVALIIAIAHGAAGIGVLRLRLWGRITGLVLGLLGVGINALLLLGTLASLGVGTIVQNGVEIDPRSGVLLASVIFGTFAAVYLIVTVVLARGGQEFD